MFETCESIDAIWDQLFQAERYHLAHHLIDKVTIFSDHILLDIKHFGLKSLIRELSVDSEIQLSPSGNDDIIQLNIPVEVKRWNGRKIIIAPGNRNEPEYVDSKIHPVTKRLAQAHRWLNMIESGEYPTVARLAEGLNLDPSNLMKALKMTTLSPKIQEMIIAGDVPDTMTLTKFYSDFPEDWEAQEQHFGMKEVKTRFTDRYHFSKIFKQ